MTSPPAPLPCSTAARNRGDLALGTAAPAPRWLLVEQPGPWGRSALHESRLDRAAARALGERAAVAGVRVVLIRRPGRPVPGVRRWAYVDARPGHEASWWGTFHDEAELLGVPLDGTEGRRSDEPVYLVCTHGRHDTCCAVRGRPVAAMLATAHPERTWECSHVGGDRFAPNLVVLPHGLYYGHVEPEDALRVVTAYDAGLVVPSLLRGRSAYSSAAQAAQHHARLELGEERLDALAPQDVEDLGGERWRVLLAHGEETVRVTVHAEVSKKAGHLTCSSLKLERPRTLRLERFERLGAEDR
jgi:hypothetical protein